jgi:hypothetical protein
MSEEINDILIRFLNALRLHDIRPMSLHSEGLGPMLPPGSELQLEWKQIFADGDPIIPTPDTLVFRPKYELTVSFQSAVIFKQVSTFIIAFQIVDKGIFEELWVNEDMRKVFMEKQILKTLWPIFRQHALDGMSRLCMMPVPLPWLM